MAELPPPELVFENGCPDCGERRATLPAALPGVPDDFDWRVRDYDSIRLFMMQELAHRFPERRRWTPADMEVVLIEVVAAAFDRASHAIDAVQAERYLSTARQPRSVMRLLKLIGYDAASRVRQEVLDAHLPDGANTESRERQVERLWRLKPSLMEAARAEGPRLVAEQLRMVTLEDHAAILETHPLVSRAQARLVWSGAWSTVLISVLLEGDMSLDDPLSAQLPATDNGRTWKAIADFHQDSGLPPPPSNPTVTVRQLLRNLVERRRMIGSEVFLEPAKPAAITFTLSIRAKSGYFRSELHQALSDLFSSEEGGFFEPGRLDFGEDLYASDIIEAAMSVEGIEVACLNRFKRVGSGWPDRTVEGFVPIEDDEYVRCLNLKGKQESGYFRLVVNGGELG